MAMGYTTIAGNVWEWCVDELDVEFLRKTVQKRIRYQAETTLLMPDNFNSIRERRILRGGVVAQHSRDPSCGVPLQQASRRSHSVTLAFRCVVPVDSLVLFWAFEKFAL